MTTTHASTQAPKPAEAASKPAQQGGHARANADKPAEDLFASLLSLVSDTHQTPAGALPDGEAADDALAEADDKTGDNPLAALLAWTLPGAASPTGTGTAAAAPPTGTADGAAREGAIDVSGMARVDEAAPALPNAAAQARAAASRPAFSPLNPHAQPTTTGVTAQRAADSNALPGGAPAMVWQRGTVSSTEALQQQQSAQFAQVRATVALNERLGVSAGPEAGAGPTSPREFALDGPNGASSATGPALDGSLTAAGGTTPGDSSGSGDPASQAWTDQGHGDGRPHTDANAEAEGPTVSHWGTQHMRHASLRVGGEGADGIDIQLAVKGQEVQVAFQTDNAEARASLRESAGESLADLLQRSGIQLGGVSVGSQGQAQGDGPYQPRSAGRSTEALGRPSQAAEPAAPASPRPHADGSRPLDVFA